MENLSILTGFPFGNYHYTQDPKLFLVPLWIGPFYVATGYLAWTIATLLIGEVRRGSGWLITIRHRLPDRRAHHRDRCARTDLAHR